MAFRILVIALIVSRASTSRADEIIKPDRESTYSDFVRKCPNQRAKPQCTGEDGTKLATDTLCTSQASPAELNRIVNSGCLKAGPGAAPPTATTLPWVSIVADFFIARARVELVQFLEDRLASSLCDSKAPTAVLLPETCKLFAGADVGLSSVPAALRRDLSDLPVHLIDLGFALIDTKELSPDVRPVICVVDAVGKAYPALRDRGPLAALHEFAVLTPRKECETDIPSSRFLLGAAVLELLIKDIVPVIKQLPDKPIDRVALLNTARVFLEQQKSKLALACRKPTCDVDAEIAKLTARLDAGIIKLDSLLSLLAALDTLDVRDPRKVARVLDQLADTIGAVLPMSDETTDVISVLRAASAFASGRYVTGLLRLGSVNALTTWLGRHQTLGKTWDGVVRSVSLA